jgi:centrosomal protein CEP19
MGYDKLDMNKMTNEELNKHKVIMDSMYRKNILRPGDPGYQYNIEKQFKPQ